MPDKGYVYYVQAWEMGAIKIGWTRTPSLRLTTLQGAHPTELTLLALERGDNLKEAKRHAQFSHLRLRGEWFRPGDDLMAHITNLAEKVAASEFPPIEKRKLAARMRALATKLEADANAASPPARKGTRQPKKPAKRG